MVMGKSVHIKMDKEFRQKVEAYAKERGMKLSEAIRSMIRAELQLAGYFDKPGTGLSND